MSRIETDFESMTSGVAITAAAPAGFDGYVGDSSFGAYKPTAFYATTRAHSGTKSMRVTSNDQMYATGAGLFASGGVAKRYSRAYVYIDGSLAAGASLGLPGSTDLGDGYAYAAHISVNDDGSLLQVVDTTTEGQGATYDTTASGVIPVNAWFRIETDCPALGVWSVRVFKGANLEGTVPDVSTVSALPSKSTAVPVRSFGVFGGGVGSPYSPFYIDDIALDDAGWIGPTGGGAPTFNPATSMMPFFA